MAEACCRQADKTGAEPVALVSAPVFYLSQWDLSAALWGGFALTGGID